MGLSNHKFFLLFLLYVCSLCALAVLLVAGRVLACATAPKQASGLVEPGKRIPSSTSSRPLVCHVDAGSAIAVVMLVTLAFLFGIFTLCMMCDQYPALQDGMTMIDRYQARDRAGADSASIRRQRRTPGAALAEVFGGRAADGFQLHWLLPTAVRYPDPEAIAGYSMRTRGRRLAPKGAAVGDRQGAGPAGIDSDGEAEAMEDDAAGTDTDSDMFHNRRRF